MTTSEAVEASEDQPVPDLPDLGAWLSTNPGTAATLTLTPAQVRALHAELQRLHQSNARLRKQNRKVRKRMEKREQS